MEMNLMPGCVWDCGEVCDVRIGVGTDGAVGLLRVFVKGRSDDGEVSRET